MENQEVITTTFQNKFPYSGIAGGYIIQKWGIFNRTASTQYYTYPQAFPYETGQVLISWYSSSTGDYSDIQLYNFTASGFRVHSINGGEGFCYWAVGH